MQQKIVIIGGPGTGKSSILKELINRKYQCMPEISREVTLKAQKEGINQLFLTQPLLFSKLLLKGREQQFLSAEKSTSKWIFFDRGIPDIHAYMNYLGTKYPPIYIKKSQQYLYDKVFILPLWKGIYTYDNERYENFEQAIKISLFLRIAYQKIGYKIIDIPFGTINHRTNYILNLLKNDKV